MRAVLVHCPPHGEVPFRHIGLAYLRAVLESERVETKLLDISASEGKAGTDFYDDIILYLSRSVGDVGDGLDPRLLMEVLHPDRFDEPSPLSQRIVERLDARFEEIAAAGDVFLLPVNIITYYFAAGLAHRLRAIGKRTAAGGPSTHFAPIRDLLLRCGSFDAVVEGEGEGIVVPLVRALGGAGGGAIQGLGSLPGVAFFDGTQVHATPAAPPPALESLPDPHFEADEVRDFVPILAARGCSARCSYCSEPFNWVRHRRREPEAVLAEMDRAAKRWGVVNFHFHDDMINGNLPWFDRLLDLLIEGDRPYRWESFGGPRGLDPERLAKMRKSGCVLLKMGVQSFAPETLAMMKRRSDVNHLKAAIVNAEQHGISMHYDMLTSFPGETEEDHEFNKAMIEEIFEETNAVYFSLNPFYLAIGSDTHLRPERYGLRLRYFDPSELPDDLAEVVRAAGPLPIGFNSDLDQETIRRRVAELGEILKRHGRDYLYLGQSEVPDGSDAYQEAPSRELGGAHAVDEIYRRLLLPWRPEEIRGGWALAEMSRPGGGEDGLVRYLFRRHEGPAEATVAIRLAPRNQDRPCFARTPGHNVFYDAGEGVEGRRVEELLRVVVRLVRRNEARLSGAAKRAGQSA